MNTNTTVIESKVEIIHLFDGSSTISEKLRNEIFELVTDIPPGLQSGEFTLKFLCGDKYWNTLTMNERRSAGMYMAHMVREEMIPYVPAGRPCQSPKVYNMI